ncbi:hypothetical protein TNCV_629191 [Trichonephila clavipes]|nr:hypothetical protein TNCV_629191 [Trichonephila clavipes]
MKFLTFWKVLPGSLVVEGAEQNVSCNTNPGSSHLGSVSQSSAKNWYSYEELVSVLLVYGAVDCKGFATHMLYQGRCSNRRVPHQMTFASVNKLSKQT